MKIVYGICQEMKKSIISYGFLACVMITWGLLFTVTGYYDTDTGKTYSVLECMFMSGKMLHSQAAFSSIQMVSNISGGFFQMFLPIVAAFPFMPNFCTERRSGLIRFTISRMGKWNYYFTKFFSAILSGGLAVVMGYFLYAIVIYLRFPALSSYSADEIERVLLGSSELMRFLGSVLGVFLYGMISVLLAFLLASFLKNKYLVTCIPFTLMYIYSIYLDKMATNTFGVEGKEKLYDLQVVLNPQTICNVQSIKTGGQWNDTIIYALVWQGILLVITFLLFAFIMNRRCDSGE